MKNEFLSNLEAVKHCELTQGGMVDECELRIHSAKCHGIRTKGIGVMASPLGI